MINSSYYLATSDRCSVPAPSIAFCAGGWLAIAGQLRGKGRDRVGAAEPEESVLAGVGCRESGVGGEAVFLQLAARPTSPGGRSSARSDSGNLARFCSDPRPPILDSVVIDIKECGRLDRGHSGVLARVRLDGGRKFVDVLACQNSAPGPSAMQTPSVGHLTRFCSDPRPPTPDSRSTTCT